jgi:hypothetical protein
VKLARFRKPKAACFLSCGIQAQYNISNIIYTYKYTQTMYPKVGLVEETKGRREEGKKDRE